MKHTENMKTSTV